MTTEEIEELSEVLSVVEAYVLALVREAQQNTASSATELSIARTRLVATVVKLSRKGS